MYDKKNTCCSSLLKKTQCALVDLSRRMSPRLRKITCECQKPNYSSDKKRRMEGPKESQRNKIVKLGDEVMKSIGFHIPLLDEYDLSTFLKVKEKLRLLNLRHLHSFEEEKETCSKLNIGDLRLHNRSNTKVVGRLADKGVPKLTVYKHRLKRLQGQPKSTSNSQARRIKGQGSKFPSALRGLVNEDISCGQEDLCIPATNVVDNPPVAPSGFTYISSIQFANNVIVPPTAPGCGCKGRCTAQRSCSCARLNGSDFPYVRQYGGRLFEPKDVVFECGPSCGCGPSCVNRTSQRGLKYRLEVYRTKDKGWAVRSWDFIPSGAPVCEYTGIIRRTDELDNVSENDYFFEIDCWQTMNEIGARERRFGNVSVPATDVAEKINGASSESSPEFCIDAGRYGNVARFINHSCDPNLFVQCVLSSHHDLRLARVVLFASDDIPPMQELTYDYGYELDSVTSPNGQIKKMPCNCGTADCRKRLY